MITLILVFFIYCFDVANRFKQIQSSSRFISRQGRRQIRRRVEKDAGDQKAEKRLKPR
ncbi:hypothetical protein PO124_09845 [Bacillus licheniformis]|nr:hypothetical protein [Bacillus licheniformis]